MKKLLFLLLFCSCSHIKYDTPVFTTITFYADNDFNADERETIQEALRWWESSSYGYVKLSVKFVDLRQDPNWRTDGQSSIYKATKSWKYQTAITLCELPFWGCTAPDSGDIFITEINFQFLVLMAHEIGHALMRSNWHSSNKESVMYPFLGNMITREDIYRVWYR